MEVMRAVVVGSRGHAVSVRLARPMNRGVAVVSVRRCASSVALAHALSLLAKVVDSVCAVLAPNPQAKTRDRCYTII